MLFKLHYSLVFSASSALTILLGVYIKEYTDASTLELGVLIMLMPFTSVIFRPLICSMADRTQAYQKTLMVLSALTSVSYLPFIIIPLLGPQVYQKHARVCWYVLLVSKVCGDISYGGATCIGDSLAVNYADKTGGEFRTYRVWGTISFMAFGIILGQVNEVYFLPKYVPGFIIFCTSFFLDFIIIWLWPAEYFVMQKKDRTKRDKKEQKKKSLLPREVVLAEMKNKIMWLLTLGYTTSHNSITLIKNEIPSSSMVEDTKCNSIPCAIRRADKRTQVDQMDEDIDNKTQMIILMKLIREDPRIILYMMYFICSGASLSPLYFYFPSLSDVCHIENRCDFSQLAGMIQVSVAAGEIISVVSLGKIAEKTGRVNLCALALLLMAIKYTFYGTIADDYSPYYSILAELLQGAAFGVFLTYTVDTGHLFTNEVEFILPDLIKEGLVEGGEAREEKLRLSLSATMQSLMTSAQDGIGRALSSLLCSLFLESYSYTSLWVVIGVSLSSVSFIMFTINIIDYIFKFELGLDVKFAKEVEAVERKQANIFSVKLEEDSKMIVVTQKKIVTAP